MRPRRLATAVALLAALALALAACTGSGLPPAAAPEASPAAEAPSAPAPASPPEQACANGVAVEETAPASEGGPCVPARYTAACSKGVAVPDPEANRGLVRDCALLLLARDPLRGTAPLNWSEDLPIGAWDGLGFNGDPPRVDGVHLRDRGLDGVIPHWLGGLTELVYLHLGAQNHPTGPIPAGLGGLRDLAGLHLTNNRLTGVIPDLSGTNLSRLDLRGNELTGGVPAWLGEMTNLRVLNLRGNEITGGVPARLGELTNLRVLSLQDNELTGPIPRSIGRLPLLREVRLAQNELTGCVPSPLEDVAPSGPRNDVAELGLPWCLRYALDATGAVASAGRWAILDAGGGADAGGGGVSGQAEAPPAVITTWEGLRSEAATLRVHQTDAAGTSWAAEFGAVSEDDLFEWRKASDCWVRYRVTGDPVRPAAGSGRWEFPVEWMTYAATGEGCTGAVGASAVLSADESVPMVIPATAITSPVRHGIVLLSPESWEGETETSEWREPLPTFSGGVNGASGSSADAAPIEFGVTDSLEEARRFRYWRDPVLPPGWTFLGVEAGGHNAPYFGYCAGWTGVYVCVKGGGWRPWHLSANPVHGLVSEPRVIDGRPAIVQYALAPRYYSVSVWIFDRETGIEYSVVGIDHTLRDSNTEAAIAIARSLLPD